MSNFKITGVTILPLFTFLVSFYNAQKYIAQCITNLKKQTNSEFLCILVDDGSRDESFEIAKKEIDGDKRFSIIKHEKNLGLGAGRVTGIENTKTDFLTFIDADDEIQPDAAEIIISNIITQNADLYVYDYFQNSEQGKVKLVSGQTDSVNQLFKDNDKRISHVWHKVYKTKIIKCIDLSFYKTISFAEDLYLCIKVFLAAKSIILINKTYYSYIYNSESLVNSRSEKSIRENINVLKELLSDDDIKKNPVIEKYLKYDSYHAFSQLIFPNKKNHFQWEKPHFCEWRKINNEIKIYIPEDISFFIRFYLNIIKKKHDFTAKMLWNFLKIKEFIK